MPRTKEVCPAGAVRDRPPPGPLCTQLSVGTGRASPKCRESSGVGWGCCRALGLGRPPRARMGCNHRPKGPKDSLRPPGGPQHCAWAEACRGASVDFLLVPGPAGHRCLDPGQSAPSGSSLGSPVLLLACVLGPLRDPQPLGADAVGTPWAQPQGWQLFPGEHSKQVLQGAGSTLVGSRHQTASSGTPSFKPPTLQACQGCPRRVPWKQGDPGQQ